VALTLWLAVFLGALQLSQWLMMQAALRWRGLLAA
jgi:hypothetical protein